MVGGTTGGIEEKYSRFVDLWSYGTSLQDAGPLVNVILNASSYFYHTLMSSGPCHGQEVSDAAAHNKSIYILMNF